MNKTKISNPVRLIAFFLTAFLLISTFGFTADGWQIGDTSNNSDKPDSSLENSSGNNKDDNLNEEDSTNAEIYIPAYINRLTGLEITEEEANKAHLALVLNGNSAHYGISGADLICEIPTESCSRLIAFIPEYRELWKCGSIAPTRGYISNIAKYFGGICISYGNDDSIEYNKCNISGMHLDVSSDKKYHYTEFSNNVYTNSDLLFSGINDIEVNLDFLSAKPPYNFVDFGKDPVAYEENLVDHIIINDSTSFSSELFYNKENNGYTLSKNGMAITDAINGKQPNFTNCFILFADSVTYDNANCSQMVMDTIGTGVGYYFTNGGMCEIKWSGSEDGNILFTLTDGTSLVVNRGRSYITFLKSSMKESIRFE